MAIDIKQALREAIQESYLRLGDQGSAALASSLDDLERFLEALPDGKQVRPAVLTIVKRTIDSAMTFGPGFSPLLAVQILTYINSESE